jgi:hypothetical protein
MVDFMSAKAKLGLWDARHGATAAVLKNVRAT